MVNRFWIPFTRETVEMVIAEHNGHYKNLVLGEARESGDKWYGSNSFTVYNLEEFISASFEDVLAAIRGCSLKQDYGGVIQYQKHRERKKLEAEVAEFQNTKKSKK